MLSFSSKAETLEKLESLITKAKILPQIRFCADEWDHSSLKNQVEEKGWSSTPLIVRSSSSKHAPEFFRSFKNFSPCCL